MTNYLTHNLVSPNKFLILEVSNIKNKYLNKQIEGRKRYMDLARKIDLNSNYQAAYNDHFIMYDDNDK